MNRLEKNGAVMLVGLALLGASAPMMQAKADIVPQVVEMVKVDVEKLSTGYRASKIIGSNVVNDADETIGKVDDLIVNPADKKSAYVILSVGGWLGMGTRLVALPYDNLRISSSKIILPGATKEGLKALPEFKYSST